MIIFPRRKRGRQSADADARYQDDLESFCQSILQINSTLDFKISSRGWCYILEEHGLTKGDFDSAQKLINQCRKNGDLPLNICAVDDSRSAANLEIIDDHDVEAEAEYIVDNVEVAYLGYHPISFWNDQDFYLEMMVEKIDLKNLFAPICSRFNIPLANAKGWSDIHSRAAMMARFEKWENDGKQCVLLYCGDHDPGGLSISDFLKSNLADLSESVGWGPDRLVIDRFGLNHDFIEEQSLTWIDNLETSSGGRLDAPGHPDHRKSYVQSYLAQFGVRKVEANALVVRAEAGRDLCRQAILKYVREDAPELYRANLSPHQLAVRDEVQRLLEERWS
ncbi:MAG: hypothetical protein HQ514_15910 [Rhodospirillales bacterium]|nr:hypothetical protein [Rhodospirillales bacterium]